MANIVWVALYVIVGYWGWVLARSYWRTRGRLEKKRARIAQRERIPINAVYPAFFASSGLNEPKVTELWLEVARTLRVDPGKLRPSDRFDRELAPVPEANAVDELEDLAEIVRRRSAIVGIDVYGSWWHWSIEEYIMAFCPVRRI